MTPKSNGDPHLGQILRSILRTYPKRLSLTGSLVLLENAVEIFYPVAAGIALDAVLRSDLKTALLMVGVIFSFWLIGAVRRAVDTRVYAKIYANLAENVIRSERLKGVPSSAIVAHTTQARQFVDFFEEQVPLFVTAVVTVVGSIVMLLVLEPAVGIVAAALVVGFAIYAVGFTRKSEYLASCLHHHQERQARAVISGNPLSIQRHFKMLGARRVALSDVEARGYVVVGVVVAILFTTLFAHLSLWDGVTAGHIYMLMSYSWNIAFNIDEMPSQLQQLGKIKELGTRIRPELSGNEGRTQISAN